MYKKRIILFLVLTLNIFCLFSQESYFFDKDENVRSHSFEEEFVEDLSFNEMKNMVRANDEVFVRSTYNNQMLLSTKTVWKNSSKNKFELIQKYEYVYNELALSEDDYYLKSITLYDYEKKQKSISVYEKIGQKNLIVSETLISLSEDNIDKDDLKNVTFGKKTEMHSYQYNSEGLITSKLITKYDDSENQSSEKIVYHVPGDKNGSFDLFSNDILQLTRNYINEVDYKETLYFPSGHSVETTYSGGRVILEIFYNNGIEIRRSLYNQEDF